MPMLSSPWPRRRSLARATSSLTALLAILLASALGPPVAQATSSLTWSGPVPVDTAEGGDPRSVSCPTETLCVAVDFIGNVLTSTNPTGGAAAWTVTAIDPTSHLMGVSCPTTTFCAAVDFAGNVLTSTDPTGGAAAWTSTKTSSDFLWNVSCPTSTFCTAVGESSDIWTSTEPTGGTSAWHNASVDSAGRLAAVDCPSVALCVAVDDKGNELTSTNPTGGAAAWSTPVEIAAKVNETPEPLNDVSCPTTTFCVATDGYDYIDYEGFSIGSVVVSTNPTGGAGAWTLSPTIANGLFGVSCPLTSHCLTADFDHIYSLESSGAGATWSTSYTGTFAYTQTLTDLDCPSTELCVAFDTKGNVFTGTPAGEEAHFMWSGKGSSSAWSDGGNWQGNTAPAPSSSIDTLTFPLLPSAATANNDLSGLSVNQLLLDDSHGYTLNGQGFTLGGGGLSVSTAEGSGGSLKLAAPISLEGSQSWNIAGPTNLVQPVEVSGQLTGAASNLTINLNTANTLFVLGTYLSHEITTDDELGDVTIGGPSMSHFYLYANLNHLNGHSLTVEGVQFHDQASTGPLNLVNSQAELNGPSTGALTTIGSYLHPGRQLKVASAKLDETSTIYFAPSGHGTQPGTDFNQITSSGAVNLGNVQLSLNGQGADVLNGGCQDPTPGLVYPIISTTGSLSGTFKNVPDGSTVTTTSCVSFGPKSEILEGGPYSYRINYNRTSSPRTVTATVLPTALPVPVSVSPPTIAGSPMVGQLLTAAHGSWTNAPTGYAEQWQRCDGTGNNCQAIGDATSQTYSLSTSDAGSTVRLAETASNATGPGTPALSAPTVIVQSRTTDGPPSKETPNEEAPKAVAPKEEPPIATISTAQLKALLARQLVPSGKAGKIRNLLKHGGLTMPFQALTAGTVTVGWYQVPVGAKLAKRTTAKPVLVASGKLTFAGAGRGQLKLKLTAAGRQVLRHAKHIKLTAKGTFAPSGQADVSAVGTLSLRR
jgi:hypothetical protein